MAAILQIREGTCTPVSWKGMIYYRVTTCTPISWKGISQKAAEKAAILQGHNMYSCRLEGNDSVGC